MDKFLLKRVGSGALAAVLMFGCTIVSVTAAENTEKHKIYLDVTGTEWTLDGQAYCHIWNETTGEVYTEWHTKSEKMTANHERGQWEFDITDVAPDFDETDGKDYTVTFYYVRDNEHYGQTYSIVMSGECSGETLYITEDVDNRDDSLEAMEAFYFGEWKGSVHDCGTKLTWSRFTGIVGHAWNGKYSRAFPLAKELASDKCFTNNSNYGVEDINNKLAELQATKSELKIDIENLLSYWLTETSLTEEKVKAVKVELFALIDHCTDPVMENNIYFDVFASEWNSDETIYCNVYSFDGTGEWADWGTKKQECEYDPIRGVAIYDLNKTGNKIDISDKNLYGVMFGTISGKATKTLTMSGDCIGDVVYCEYNPLQAPADSNYKLIPYWRNNTESGTLKSIDNSGVVTGTSLPYGMTDEMLLSDYLIKKADEISAEDAQDKINQLCVRVEDVETQVEKNAEGEVLSRIKYVLNMCVSSADAPLYGDTNGDGVLKVTDATEIAKYCADLTELGTGYKKIADVNRDGIINIQDATKVQKIIAGL